VSPVLDFDLLRESMAMPTTLICLLAGLRYAALVMAAALACLVAAAPPARVANAALLARGTAGRLYGPQVSSERTSLLIERFSAGALPLAASFANSEDLRPFLRVHVFAGNDGDGDAARFGDLE